MIYELKDLILWLEMSVFFFFFFFFMETHRITVYECSNFSVFLIISPGCWMNFCEMLDLVILYFAPRIRIRIDNLL